MAINKIMVLGAGTMGMGIAQVFAEAGKIRLKDFCNLDYGTPAKYAGNDVSILKKGAKAVQWVGPDAMKATLLMPDGSVREGLIERAFAKEQGESVHSWREEGSGRFPHRPGS